MLIAFTGQARSGKDTVAKFVRSWDPDYEHILFAGPLKAMIRTLFIEAGYSEEQAEEFINGDRKMEPLELFQGKTTRYAMQTLGTEWRNFFGPNLWSDIIDTQVSEAECVTITDMRFLHEEDFVDDRGGWKVRTRRFGQMKSKDPHPSEQEMEAIKAHYTIFNYGTLADLEAAAELVFTALNMPHRSLADAAEMLYS